MFKLFLFIIIFTMFICVCFVIIDINKYLSEFCTALFIICVVFFMISFILFKLEKVPFVYKTYYHYNIEQLAKEHNAKIEYTLYDEVLVHEYSKKDKIDQWIYYKVDPRVAAQETEETKSTNKVKETKKESGYG